MDHATTAAPLRPSSLGGWFLSLWREFLFPGPSSVDSAPPRLISLLLVLLLPACLLYTCLDFRLLEPDESRYAQIPREMLDRGDWIVPTLQAEPYLDKPPLFYWLVMLSYQTFGVHDWAARLVPALAVHLTLLAVYLLGRRTLGERPALLASFLLALAPGSSSVARLLILDGLLTLLVTIALLTAFEAVRGNHLHLSWWLLAATATGLGILTKGPVALILILPPLFVYRRLSGNAVAPGWKAWVAFAAVVAILAMPWYVALSLRVPGFVRYFFWEHNFQRFVATGMHVRGVWFYAPILLLLLLPGSLLLPWVARLLFSGDANSARRRSPELGFHLLAGAWVVFFFTLSSCKLPTYVLPALPFFGLSLGYIVVARNWDRQRWFMASATVSFAFAFLAHFVALPWYASYRSPMSRPAEVLALCNDRETPVVCYPRNCDSIAFYLNRNDIRAYRSKEIEELRFLIRTQPKTVVLCTHRHSLEGLRELLPPEVRITHEVRMGLGDIPGIPRRIMKPLARLMGETALGLSDLAVIEAPGWREAAEGARLRSKLVQHIQIRPINTEDGDDDE